MIPRPLKMAIVLSACLASCAFASDSLTLVNPNAYYPMGGVYTSPYLITVNGTPMLLICDDFLTDIGIGYQWSATSSTVSALANESSPSMAVKFDHPGSPSPDSNETVAQQKLDYATAAYLANELMTLPAATANNWGNETAGEISYAIWGIFDTQLLTQSYQNSLAPGAVGKLSGGELSQAQAFLSTAQAAVVKNGAVDFSALPNVTIYTSTPQNGSGSSQEFLRVSMAEPSYPAVLAVDLLAVVGLMVVLRRRITGILD